MQVEGERPACATMLSETKFRGTLTCQILMFFMSQDTRKGDDPSLDLFPCLCHTPIYSLATIRNHPISYSGVAMFTFVVYGLELLVSVVRVHSFDLGRRGKELRIHINGWRYNERLNANLKEGSKRLARVEKISLVSGLMVTSEARGLDKSARNRRT